MQAKDLEWGWSDSPILLPLAYQQREWNAAFIAMHIAEYSGSQLIAYHVSLATESASVEFREEVRSLAEKLKVKISFVEEETEDGSFDNISRMIITQAIKQNAQAIIMPAHKEGFFKELVGRVSDRVAQRNPTKTVLVETPDPKMKITSSPRKIAVLVKPGTEPKDAFIVAAALTSLATAPDAELLAAQAILLPQTVPLDAMEYSNEIRLMERRFAETISSVIKNLGRMFSPRILASRQLGKDIADFVIKEKVDILILTGHRRNLISGLFGTDTKDIVGNAPCVSLIVFS
jgi:nucleotide-binding universal stress UspA family protein